jgi:hypothetical protein
MSSNKLAPKYCYLCKGTNISACSKSTFRCRTCGRKMYRPRSPIAEERAACVAKLKAEALTKLEALVELMREQGRLECFHIDAGSNRLIWYTVSDSEPRREGVLAEAGTPLELDEITNAVYGRLQELRPPKEKPKVLSGKDLDAKAKEVWKRKEIHEVEPRAYRSALA